MGGLKLHKTMSKLPAALDDFNLSSIVKSDPNSLVCVQLRMVNRSVPVPNSAVAIPSTEDTTSLGKCRNCAGPVEPLHKGPRAQLADKALINLAPGKSSVLFLQVIALFRADVGLEWRFVPFRVL